MPHCVNHANKQVKKIFEAIRFFSVLSKKIPPNDDNSGTFYHTILNNIVCLVPHKDERFSECFLMFKMREIYYCLCVFTLIKEEGNDDYT